ncbi:hypothetical protein ACLI4Z_10610 [Natrialbaceae archaeon A-arb3/5]
MKRALATAVGLLEVLAPTVILGPAERLAFENPDVGRLRRWTLPMARLEGLLFIWLVNRDRPVSSQLRAPLVAFGIVMALIPRTVVESGLEICYENADELELQSWVIPVTRLLGACYLVAGLAAERAGGPTEE